MGDTDNLFSMVGFVYILIVVLKIVGAINLNWFLVLTSFIWIPFLLIIMFLGIIGIVSAIILLFSR